MLKDPALLQALAAAPKPAETRGERPPSPTRGDASWPKQQTAAAARSGVDHRGAASSQRCCRRSSSRKTDRAREAVEAAVRTLAAAGAARRPR